jgi:glycosyl transferase family 25
LQAYVITLPRSRDRQDHVSVQLEKCGVPWEWVEGVDARKANLVGSRYLAPEMAARSSLRPGAIGCALGHKKAYERVLASGLPYALILEDDVEVPADLLALAGKIGKHLRGAELALLNFRCPGGVKLKRRGAVDLGRGQLLAEPASLDGLTSGAAYVVANEACRRLTRAALPMRAFCDEWEWFVRQGVLERVFCVTPMPVRQSLDFRTTIDYYAPGSLRWYVGQFVSGGLGRLPVLRLVVRRKRLTDYERWGAGHAELVDVPSPASEAGPADSEFSWVALAPERYLGLCPRMVRPDFVDLPLALSRLCAGTLSFVLTRSCLWALRYDLWKRTSRGSQVTS